MPQASLIRPLLSAIVLANAIHAGFNEETGSYVFQNYGARDYAAAPDNWAIAQDKRGILYFGNTDGVLIFDGVSWRAVALPNKSVARSLSIDQNGTVYVGGVGEFGFLRPDEHGTPGYVSLLGQVQKLDQQFGDVWRTIATPQGIFFSSYSRIFRVGPNGAVKVWNPKTRFGRAFYLSDGVYVKTPERGLLRLTGDAWTSVPDGEKLAGAAVEDGVETSLGAIIATRDRLYRKKTDGLEPFLTAADAYFSKNLIYSLKEISSKDMPGLIAVGTRRGGLVLLNRDGGVERIVSSGGDGLPDDFIAAIHVDPQGAVWLAENNGITRFNPGLTRYGKADQLPGNVQVMDRYEGHLYAGTTLGVFRMQTAAGSKPHFIQVEGLNSKVWCLWPAGTEVLAGTDQGIALVSGVSAEPIVPDVRRAVLDLSGSPGDPNLVYAAGAAGVFALRRIGKEWEKVAEIAPPGQEFRSVVEDQDGRVWATTQQGVWRIDFRKQPAVTELFGVAQGVPLGWKTARRFQGHVVFATEQGLQRYAENMRRFTPDTGLGVEFANGSRDVFNVFEERSGRVWVTGKGYHEMLYPKQGGYQRMAAPLLRSGIREIYWMHSDDDGTVWALGDESVLYRWEPGVAGDPDRNFQVLTRRVQVAGDKELLYGGEGTLDSIRVPFRSNALRFDFAAPFYEDPMAVEYQVLLEGSDRNWTAWSHEQHRDYTNLSEGSYRFRVRARSPHGAVNEQSAFTFGVLPPWYRTWWAYLLYLIGGGFGVWGVVRWRTRHLEAEKRQLEVIVEERTVEIREQRDEIQAQERKSQALLLNILPSTVADELKSTGAVQPVGFDEVTVCFTDFVGFTLSSEKLPPGKLVDSLNEYFTAFDEIVARYGLEKLKTIGDSYMFASGLPLPRRSHAVDAVLAAIEMTEVVKDLARKPHGTAWGIRVGLHSGPVVAGVVGIRKFAFDIWGNTVNFAARMESSGLPGQVNISEQTCQLLRGLIECEARGKVRIKEGRELPMFLVTGLATSDETEFVRRYERQFGLPPKAWPENAFAEARTVAANRM